MSFEFNPNRGSQLHQPPPRYIQISSNMKGAERLGHRPCVHSSTARLDNNQSLPLCGPPVDPHEDGSYYMNMSSSSFHQPSSVAYSYPRNTNRGIGQSTRHSSVNPSLGLPFSSSTSSTLLSTFVFHHEHVTSIRRRPSRKAVERIDPSFLLGDDGSMSNRGDEANWQCPSNFIILRGNIKKLNLKEQISASASSNVIIFICNILWNNQPSNTSYFHPL